MVSGEMSSDRSVQPARDTFEQFECIEEALHRALSPGARVYVDEEDALWDQRLVELSSPELVVVDEADDATHVISVDPATGEQSCAGLRLTTRSQ